MYWFKSRLDHVYMEKQSVLFHSHRLSITCHNAICVLSWTPKANSKLRLICSKSHQLQQLDDVAVGVASVADEAAVLGLWRGVKAHAGGLQSLVLVLAVLHREADVRDAMIAGGPVGVGGS